MLLLGRRDGQSVTITTPSGEVITVTMVVGRGKLKLGIEADRSVKVLRSELLGEPYVRPIQVDVEAA